MSFRTRALRSASAAVILTLALTACSTDVDEPSTTDEPGTSATPRSEVTGTPAADAKIIEITLDGDSVEPSGRRVEVKRGQPIVLRIDAEDAGELHIHSDPEQEIGFPAGNSEYTLVIDQPGVVDVEDHALDALIVSLEVN